MSSQVIVEAVHRCPYCVQVSTLITWKHSLTLMGCAPYANLIKCCLLHHCSEIRKMQNETEKLADFLANKIIASISNLKNRSGKKDD